MPQTQGGPVSARAPRQGRGERDDLPFEANTHRGRATADPRFGRDLRRRRHAALRSSPQLHCDGLAARHRRAVGRVEEVDWAAGRAALEAAHPSTGAERERFPRTRRRRRGGGGDVRGAPGGRAASLPLAADAPKSARRCPSGSSSTGPPPTARGSRSCRRRATTPRRAARRRTRWRRRRSSTSTSRATATRSAPSSSTRAAPRAGRTPGDVARRPDPRAHRHAPRQLPGADAAARGVPGAVGGDGAVDDGPAVPRRRDGGEGRAALRPSDARLAAAARAIRVRRALRDTRRPAAAPRGLLRTVRVALVLFHFVFYISYHLNRAGLDARDADRHPTPLARSRARQPAWAPRRRERPTLARAVRERKI